MENMILLIDVGNSLVDIGIHNQKKIINDFQLETKKIKTKDEFAILLMNLLSYNGLNKEEITGGALASVVPSVNNVIIEGVKNYFNISLVVVEPGIKIGIIPKIDNPKELGADLIADALASHIKYKGKILVVNCGTATKYSVIDERGNLLGVAIAPGFEIGSEGLFQKTAQLPDIGLRLPKDIIGKNSIESISSGLYFSYVEGIKGYISLIKGKYGEDIKVVLSGGLSKIFADYLKDSIDYVNTYLTLEGLKIAYDKNRI